MLRRTGQVRGLVELSFSAYFALLVVTEEETCKQRSVFLRWLAYPLNEYIYPLLMRHHIHLSGSHSVTLWLLLALIIFFVMRLLSRFAGTGVVLRYIPGFVAVVGFPLLLLPPCNMSALHSSRGGWIWLYLEMAAAAVCVLLYLIRRRPAKMTLTVVLLATHFGVWGWLTWERIDNPFWAIYLLLGFCSALLWGVYLGQLEIASRPEAATAQKAT